MVTRGKAKAGGARRTTTKIRSSVAEEGGAWLRGRLDCSSQEKSRRQRQRQADDDGGNHRAIDGGPERDGNVLSARGVTAETNA